MKTFRKELIKILPGYKWTVHKSFDPDRYMSATGIQSVGFNRMSTVEVTRTQKGENVEYEAKISGFGKRTPWLATYTGMTLARALRGLQEYCENRGRYYFNQAQRLASGRK